MRGRWNVINFYNSRVLFGNGPLHILCFGEYYNRYTRKHHNMERHVMLRSTSRIISNGLEKDAAQCNWNATAKQLRCQDVTKLRMVRMTDKSAGAVTPVPLTLESATTPVIEVVTILNPAIHSQWMRQQTNEWKEGSSLNYDPSKKKKKSEERNIFLLHAGS